MSFVITPNILDKLINKHNQELSKIINNENVSVNLINSLVDNNIFNNKKHKINNEKRCKALNSHGTQCKRNHIKDKEYCKKHLDKNNGNYCDSYKHITTNIRIDCEYITIDNIEYIYNKNNLLLFNNDLYNLYCVGIYYENKIIRYDPNVNYSDLLQN